MCTGVGREIRSAAVVAYGRGGAGQFGVNGSVLPFLGCNWKSNRQVFVNAGSGDQLSI